MSWWISIVEYLRSPEDGQNNGQFSVKKTIIKALAESAVDLLYYVVGFFTMLYFFFAAYLFWSGGGAYHDIAVRIFDSLSEPYLGSIGIYVILKEMRKRQAKTKSKHLGEYFVYSWLALFLAAIGFIWFSQNYYFDDLMGTITTVTLASLVIYTGGIIHKP